MSGETCRSCGTLIPTGDSEDVLSAPASQVLGQTGCAISRQRVPA
jgi:hypothetical protein